MVSGYFTIYIFQIMLNRYVKKKIKFILIMGLCLIMFYSGCNDESKSIQVNDTNSIDLTLLLNKIWKLQSSGKIGKEKILGSGIENTLQFKENNKVDIFDGCNSSSDSTYEVKTDRNISFIIGSFTLKACNFLPQDTTILEDRFSNLLIRVTSYEVEQNQLRLFYDSKQSVMNFIFDTASIIPPELLNKEWKLRSSGLIGKETEPDLKGTIQFKENKEIEVKGGGCNEAKGTYEIVGKENLTVNITQRTTKECASLDDEYRYFDRLKNVSIFELEQKNLRLFYDSNQSVLNFVVD